MVFCDFWLVKHCPTWMNIRVAKEGSKFGRRMNWIIVRKLCKMQIIYLIMLLIIDEAMKVLFQGLIGTFGLTINLWMIAWREFTISLVECKQLFPKCQDKLWSFITNGIIRETMIPIHFTHNQICCLLTINNLYASWKMHHLSEPIYDSKDGIKTFGDRRSVMKIGSLGKKITMQKVKDSGSIFHGRSKIQV